MPPHVLFCVSVRRHRARRRRVTLPCSVGSRRWAMLAWWFRIPFWQRVAAGFVLGALVGWAMGPAAGTWLQPLGTLYVNLIRMTAVPLVFFAVLNAVSALHGQQRMAQLGGRTFGWFALTAVLAVGWRSRCPR